MLLQIIMLVQLTSFVDWRGMKPVAALRAKAWQLFLTMRF